MENETDTKILNDYYLVEVCTEVAREDSELGNSIYELRRAIKSPWPEDLLPAVNDVLETIHSYRWAVKRLLSQIAKEYE